ncbi:hypothetical protein Taro_035281 [Colocasia esculenta]|uniref:Aminotransferase-like plant mobile domain-containing protein n=1 Tax=Colocasia esculenta TaxID=4460 RepID=A0A843W3C4_COLES|nr:hypothetical protein [Colocasia esculenta]
MSWSTALLRHGRGLSGCRDTDRTPKLTGFNKLNGEMRARVSWTLVLAVFLAFPPFQRERIEEMGFGEIFRMERMRVDPALTQALWSRWDAEVTTFVFPWGHMIPSLEDVSQITGLRVYGKPVSGFTYPCYHDLAERLLEFPVERRSSLVPRVVLQESLGLYEVGKSAGESEDEYLERLVRISLRELASEPGAEADMDLHRFLVLFLGRHLFATRGDTVHCRFLPLLEDLSEDSRRDARNLGDQLERLQEAIASYPYLDVVWQPYLGEGDEGQPWLVPARPYFGRSVWLHALNLVLPLHLFLSQRSLGLRQSAVEFPVRDRFRRPGRSFRGLHDTTDWHERAKEQINNWEHRGKAVKSDATTDDAYLQAYALKYGGKVYKSARHQVDVAGEIASLRALLYSAVQDREAAQRQTAELLAGAVLRAEEAERHLEERLTTEHAMDLQGQRDQLQGQRDQLQGEIQTTRSEWDQLRIREEAAEAQVAEATRELEVLRVQRSLVDREELEQVRAKLWAQKAVSRSLQQIVTDIGRSRSRSKSGASASRATGASVGQYLAGSSSRWRNEEEERRRQGEASTQSARGGEMLPPSDRQEGSGESGGGQ